MVQAGFIDEILSPAICSSEYNGTVASELSLEQEATVARGTLALANLSCNCGCECPSVGRRALETVVKVLDCAVRGETLATITWLPTTVLFGICNAAVNQENALILLESGIAPPLARLLISWEPAAGNETLELGIRAVERLAAVEGSFEYLWSAGMLAAVIKVAEGNLGDISEAARRVVFGMQERHVAVCMGHDRRLGQGSPLMLVDDAVMHMVLSLAYPPPVLAPAGPARPRSTESVSRPGWLVGDAGAV
jgi:hypothetical protein